MTSIRRNLLIILLPVVAAVVLFTSIIIYYETRTEVNNLIDAQLTQSATVLLNYSGHELMENQLYQSPSDLSLNDLPTATPTLHHVYEQLIAFQIWLDGNQLALRSDKSPRQPMSDLASGFSDATIGDHSWRVYALSNTDLKIRVLVAISRDRIEELREKIARRTLVPIIFSLPILGVLIWLGVSSAINPLHRVTAEVKSRRADDLAPVAVAAVPEEVSPLIEALNALFKRVEAAFDNERRFTSDAAHELRTPLAGLKLQAQLALQATDNVTRKTALQHVITGADRATHMVQQLLTIARLAPETGLSGAVEFNLTEVASRVLADIDRYAHGKNVELKLDASNEIKVTGDPDAISIMIGNLVRNAVEYTPSGGTVELYVANSEGNTILSVGDSGPGIPRDERDKVFSRFYRQPGTPGPGCGLGLSIVKRIADLHHARIVLGESPYGGLQVDVYFSNTTPVTTN